MKCFGRLDPVKRRAHAILDRAAAGESISQQTIDRALYVLGDYQPPSRAEIAQAALRSRRYRQNPTEVPA